MVAHHAQSVGIPPPVALTMMIVGRWTWGRSAYRWTKSAATMALAIRAKSLSASVMRSRRQQPEYAPVKAACSSPVWLNPLLIPTRVKADSFQGFQNGASSESCPSASATGPMHDAQCGLVLGSAWEGSDTPAPKPRSLRERDPRAPRWLASDGLNLLGRFLDSADRPHDCLDPLRGDSARFRGARNVIRSNRLALPRREPFMQREVEAA